MLVNNSSALARLNSPNNLINQLKANGSRKNAMNLFVRPRSEEKVVLPEVLVPFNPFNSIKEAVPASEPQAEPSINSLLENSNSQIKLATAHDNALEVLTNAVEMMKNKLDEIKPDKLPAVITATSKVVESIRRERSESAKDNKGREVHYHFYTPTQRRVVDYDVIDVG